MFQHMYEHSPLHVIVAHHLATNVQLLKYLLVNTVSPLSSLKAFIMCSVTMNMPTHLSVT